MPAPRPNELWVVNGAITDVTTQRLIRSLRPPWLFWGELPSQPKSAWHRRLQRCLYAPLRRASAIVAVGERARRAYETIAPGVTIYNQAYTCDLRRFADASATKRPGGEPVFLFCGQMISRKGIDLLLQAFSQLVAAGASARLELVGREGELPALMEQLPPAVRSRIVYTGFLPPADLPAVFARADIFILPSRHDGWGVVINQALGAGLPVIASEGVGAAQDLVQHDWNGLVVPTGDITALSSAMWALASDPERRRKMSENAMASSHALAPEHAAAFWEELAVRHLSVRHAHPTR
nr:glycosyltransferase family 4 protein [Opitutus sp. ER46]